MRSGIPDERVARPRSRKIVDVPACMYRPVRPGCRLLPDGIGRSARSSAAFLQSFVALPAAAGRDGTQGLKTLDMGV